MRMEEAKKAMPASPKIITKLRERRQIEAELRKMPTARSDLEFQQQAQEIASLGSQVIPTIIGNLDQADAEMLAAMGAVATYLDHDEVTVALRQAVLQPQRSDRGRVGAMTILERFLGQPPDQDLAASLSDPEGMAIASLEEILSQAEGNPAILIPTIEELDRQEPDVVLAVARSLQDMGVHMLASGQASSVVEPLRMMAQDVREEIAMEALHLLGSLRLPEAARAMQMLIPIVAPTLQPLAERLLRKLQFSGVAVEPLPQPDANWRALISPLNGLGQQSVWFIQEHRSSARAQFLNILLSDRAGAIEAVGHSHVPALMLPPRRSLGHLHDIALPDGSGAMLMLETTFDLGRRLVLEALAHNRETQIPVAGSLRLLSPWLWGYAGADQLPPRMLPQLAARDEALVGISDRLLGHPAFVTWRAHSEATFRAAEEALRHPGWDREVWVKRLTNELFSGPIVAQVLSERLTGMSEWLLLAGDELRAKMALVCAKAVQRGDAQDQPFLRAMVLRDLELASRTLKRESEPVSGLKEFD
jgi:hypothetical protein